MFRKRSTKGDVQTEYSCSIRFLDDSEPIQLNFKKDTLGQWLFDRVCEKLSLVEKDYFGLRFVDAEKQRHWLDPLKTVYKQLKGVNPMVLCFRVKFYPEDPMKLHEEITRYYLYLQLRRDLHHGRLLCSPQDAVLLASYVVQSEVGDYDPQDHPQGYITGFKMLPKQNPKMEEQIQDLHKQHKNQVPAEAESNFLKKASVLDTYGVDPHQVKDQRGDQLYLGVTHQGIMTFRGSRRTQLHKWNQIRRIAYEGKMFIVHVNVAEEEDAANTKKGKYLCTGAVGKQQPHGYKCLTVGACKYLWRCAVEQQLFFTLASSINAPKLKSGGSIFNRGSKFRFSGRCQAEALTASESIKRSEPKFARTNSLPNFARNKHATDSKSSTLNTSIMSEPVPEDRRRYNDLTDSLFVPDVYLAPSRRAQGMAEETPNQSFELPKTGMAQETPNQSFEVPKTGMAQKTQGQSFELPKTGMVTETSSRSFELPKTGMAQETPSQSFELPKTGMVTETSSRSFELPKTGMAQETPSQSFELPKTGMAQETPSQSFVLPKTGMAQKTPSQSFELPKTGMVTETSSRSFELPKTGKAQETPSQSFELPKTGKTEKKPVLLVELPKTGVAEVTPNKSFELPKTGMSKEKPIQLIERRKTEMAKETHSQLFELPKKGMAEDTPNQSFELPHTEAAVDVPGNSFGESTSSKLVESPVMKAPLASEERLDAQNLKPVSASTPGQKTPINGSIPGDSFLETSIDSMPSYHPNMTMDDEDDEHAPKPSLDEQIKQLEEQYEKITSDQNHIAPGGKVGGGTSPTPATTPASKSPPRSMCATCCKVLTYSILFAVILMAVTFVVLFYTNYQHPLLDEGRKQLQFMEPVKHFIDDTIDTVAKKFK